MIGALFLQALSLGFLSQKTFHKHIKFCANSKPKKKTIILTDCKLRFKILSKSLRHPFVVHADFYCLTAKTHSIAPSTNQSFTERIEMHKPISYTIIDLYVRSELIFHEYFIGENAVQHFFTTLKSVADKLIA